MSEFTLETDGVELHGVASGPAPEGSSRPTLVFLHYFGGSALTWRPVVSLLEEGFACAAVDLRGFGTSVVTDGAESNDSYSVGAMAKDVRATIEHLHLSHYQLVAHSMGGKVALHLASDVGCPAGLAGLILVGPSPPTPEPMTDKDRAQLLAGWGSEEAARKTLAKITAHPLPENLAELAVADMLRTSAAAWRAWLELGSREDISSRMERIAVPVALIAGEKDPVISPGLVQNEIAARWKDKFSPVTVVKGVAHLMPLEAPAVLAGMIREAAGGGVPVG